MSATTHCAIEKRDEAVTALCHLEALVDILQLASYAKETLEPTSVSSITIFMQREIGVVKEGLEISGGAA